MKYSYKVLPVADDLLCGRWQVACGNFYLTWGSTTVSKWIIYIATFLHCYIRFLCNGWVQSQSLEGSK